MFVFQQQQQDDATADKRSAQHSQPRSNHTHHMHSARILHNAPAAPGRPRSRGWTRRATARRPSHSRAGRAPAGRRRRRTPAWRWMGWVRWGCVTKSNRPSEPALLAFRRPTTTIDAARTMTRPAHTSSECSATLAWIAASCGGCSTCCVLGMVVGRSVEWCCCHRAGCVCVYTYTYIH